MDSSASLEAPKPEQIEWKQLWSLAALYGSIVIGWIAYHNYQPKLLHQFNFTEFTFALLIAQSIILVLTPPIAGRIGDRFRFKSGHRIPIISSGISFAAMIFMAVAFTLFSNPGEIFKWILPVLIVLWLVSMSCAFYPGVVYTH
jgi:MFS family permease